MLTGDPDAVRRAEVVVVFEDELGRDQPARDQGLGTVEIGEDRVEQHRPLDQPGLEATPLGRFDDQRERVESPPLDGGLADPVPVGGRSAPVASGTSAPTGTSDWPVPPMAGAPTIGV